MSEVEWRGRTVPVKIDKARVFLLGLADNEAAIAQVSVPCTRRNTLLTSFIQVVQFLKYSDGDALIFTVPDSSHSSLLICMKSHHTPRTHLSHPQQLRSLACRLCHRATAFCAFQPTHEYGATPRMSLWTD